jgi:pseudouridine-5'-phosphate glycosidase
MPYPQNLHTALQVEDIIRQNGATPATIAIIEGQCHVGLTRSQLQHIAKGGKAVKKVSRRNLSYVMAMGIDGATTVSATMLLAARAGIHLFVTGGIGGVHRGAERTMDISADLTELGKTPVLVVCAGAKSVLDISLTLEYLETQGVCVGSYKTDEFPAFFTRHSGCNAPCRFDTPEQIAAALHKSTSVLGLEGGMVLGVPIPESSAAVGNEVEGAISQALEEAERGGVTGDDVTPFLLKRIQELTGGRSLEANIALVKNNALVGAQIAVAFNKLLQ